MENEIINILKQQQAVLKQLQQENAELREIISNLEDNIPTYFETLHQEVVDIGDTVTQWLQAIRNDLHNR